MKSLLLATLYTCLYLASVSLVVMMGYQIHQHADWLMLRILANPTGAEMAVVMIAFAAIALGYAQRSRIHDWVNARKSSPPREI